MNRKVLCIHVFFWTEKYCCTTCIIILEGVAVILEVWLILAIITRCCFSAGHEGADCSTSHAASASAAVGSVQGRYTESLLPALQPSHYVCTSTLSVRLHRSRPAVDPRKYFNELLFDINLMCCTLILWLISACSSPGCCQVHSTRLCLHSPRAQTILVPAY